MQYKKKDISQKLLDAGREEFLLCGYRGASIKDIAKKAGITTSNFYRYYESKNSLLEILVEPAYIETLRIIEFFSGYESSIQNFSFEDASEFFIVTLLGLFERHKRELLILYDKCEATQFADFIHRLIDQVERVLVEKLFSSPSQDDLRFCKIVGRAFVQSVFEVFSGAEDRETLGEMLKRLLIFYFAGMSGRI